MAPEPDYVIRTDKLSADMTPMSRPQPHGCVTVGPPANCSSECPPGVTCYPFYASPNPCGGGNAYCCDVPPKCDADAVQLAQPCPSGGSCYERKQCGVNIICLRFAADIDAG